MNMDRVKDIFFLFTVNIKTDKNVMMVANENGTEWKPTPKNETEANQEGSGTNEEVTGEKF